MATKNEVNEFDKSVDEWNVPTGNDSRMSSKRGYLSYDLQNIVVPTEHVNYIH